MLLDVTGVDQVDGHVATALVQAAQAAQLLGCRAVLVGMRPDVSETLVGLGTDLENLATFANLQAGLEAVMRDTRVRR